MSIKEKVENNIIVILMASAVAVGTVTFGISNFVYQQKISSLEVSFDLKIKELNSKLASIKRDLPGIEHYDIRGLFLKQGSPIESSLDYFQDDEFYSLKSDDYWNYERTNEIELLGMIMKDLPSGGLFKVLQEKAEKYPIHLWKSEKNIQMDNQGEIMNLFPHIILQKLPNSAIGEFLGVGANFAKWVDEDDDFEFDDEDLDSSEDVDDFLKAMNKAYYSDAAGMFFFMQNMNGFHSALVSENEIFRIRKLQKLGPILYSQFSTEYSNVDVAGHAKTVYLMQELLLVSDTDHLYLIKITLPSTEPEVRANEYANVNRWLTSVKFVRSQL